MYSVESGNFSFTADTLVSISPVQNLNAEYRFFVVGGKVIDGSLYRICGQGLCQPVTKPDIFEAAQEKADIWLPHPNCVMDIAIVDDEMKLVEFNCINGSGFYYNDINKIVGALSEYAKCQ
jgi:hypothetical protein